MVDFLKGLSPNELTGVRELQRRDLLHRASIYVNMVDNNSLDNYGKFFSDFFIFLQNYSRPEESSQTHYVWFSQFWSHFRGTMHCLPQFQKTLILVFEVIVQTPKTHFLTFSSETKIMKITHSALESCSVVNFLLQKLIFFFWILAQCGIMQMTF